MWKKVVQKLKLNRDDATLESRRLGDSEQLSSSRSAPELMNNNVNLNVTLNTDVDIQSLVSKLLATILALKIMNWIPG